MKLNQQITLIFSFLLTTLHQAPQFGETFGWMLPRVLLFLAPPLLMSYLLAFICRRYVKLLEVNRATPNQ